VAELKVRSGEGEGEDDGESTQRGEGETWGCEGSHGMGMDEGKECAKWREGVSRSQCGLKRKDYKWGVYGAGVGSMGRGWWYEKRGKSLCEIEHV